MPVSEQKMMNTFDSAVTKEEIDTDSNDTIGKDPINFRASSSEIIQCRLRDGELL